MRGQGALFAAVLMIGLGIGGFVAGQLATPAHAQDRAQDNTAQQIGVLTIDQDRLFTGSLFGERVVTQINSDLANLEKEFQRLEADLTAEEKLLTQRRITLTPEAFRLLADEFDERVQGIRKAQDAKARELDRRLETERAKYYGMVNPLLYTIMADMGASVIIDRRAILVGVEGVDITDDALRMIDATVGDGIAPPVATEN